MRYVQFYRQGWNKKKILLRDYYVKNFLVGGGVYKNI